jgi:hypothetical protein
LRVKFNSGGTVNKNLLDSFDESKFLCPECKKYCDKNEKNEKNENVVNSKIVCTSCFWEFQVLQDEIAREEELRFWKKYEEET